MPFIDLESGTPSEVIEGYRAQFVHTQRMSFAYWNISAGARLPEHSHPHEQVAHVLEGEFELTVGGETNVLRPGCVAVIPSNVVHSGRAVTDCKILDAFAPVREDYRERFKPEGY